ncbi:acyl-CoA thioesterase domain-containing protein, partial [Streptomyces caeni]
MSAAPRAPLAPTESTVDPLWWSWAGAHGGHVAAVALAALRGRFPGGAHPVRSLTAHFLAPVDARPLQISGTAPAVGRRAATCVFSGHQNGIPVIAGSAVFGPGRPGPAHEGCPAPAVPAPDDCPSLDLPTGLAPFERQVEIRPAG